ncbi:MAG TPA: TetR/AcrR family transcriptional regulator [Chitinophagaceae bacterium]|nr:TetR/AcrR family transcriptional regulator [Chitinophagaceae bacterium]
MGKAAATRQMILQKAFALIYTKGYQATSIDDILATTQVTKGAFYYHFKNKDDMGLALIAEVLKPVMQEQFTGPLSATDDPATTIYVMIEQLLLHEPMLELAYGCPVGNLTQEMAPWNDEFSQALEELTALWKHTLEDAIVQGQKSGKIDAGVVPQQVSAFVISGYWGVRNLGKLYKDKKVYYAFLHELKQYLQGLE